MRRLLITLSECSKVSGGVSAPLFEQSLFVLLHSKAHQPHSSQTHPPGCQGAAWEAGAGAKVPFCFLQTSDKTILYSVATTLVNCTNSYDVKEVIPELVQLAKFSKQHVPEEHPKVGTGQLRRGVRPPGEVEMLCGVFPPGGTHAFLVIFCAFEGEVMTILSSD